MHGRLVRPLIPAILTLCFLFLGAGAALAASALPPASIAVPDTDPDGIYTVSWSASATPNVAYVLQEATNPTFSTGLRYLNLGANLSVKITRRSLYANYYYRVKATRPDMTDSLWKKAANGCAVPGTQAARPGRLTVPAMDTDGFYRVKWAASAIPGALYTLQEATNRVFTAGVRTAYTGNLLQAVIKGRSPGKTYFYRIRAIAPGYTRSLWKTAANGCQYGLTPPVATEKITLQVNLDALEPDEKTEARLFEAWDGRNIAEASPMDPIVSTSYEFSVQTTIIDSLGARHLVTIYFDRTTGRHEWEFLVTCDPSEDERVLDWREQTIYAPNERYNYEEHKGAGALLYGVIQFTTKGDIETIRAWNVPPDGQVDPALAFNRIVLEEDDPYYSFPVNFTGDVSNTVIEFNLGAKYTGVPTLEQQVLVSDKGAFSDTRGKTFINRETTWDSVYDEYANGVANGDMFTWTGFKNDGTAVAGSYTVTNAAIDKVQDLLDALGSWWSFDCRATIDAKGRLVLTDNQAGDSGMYITSFQHYNDWPFPTPSVTDLFGSRINITTSKRQVVSTSRGLRTPTGIPVIEANTEWTSIYSDAGAGPVANGDTIVFSGNKPDGTPVMATYTVSTAIPNNTIQDILDWLSWTFDCDASIDMAGRLVLTDWTADSITRTSALAVTIDPLGWASDIFGKGVLFDTVDADLAYEDGSRQGSEASSDFAVEPWFSTQYAAPSRVIRLKVE